MVWEWSHTEEAYSNAKQNLELLEETVLQDIWSDIKTHRILIQQENLLRNELGEDFVEETEENYDYFDIKIYERFFEYSEGLNIDVMIDSIWEFMIAHRKCTNGGERAYCTPYNNYTVSFSNQEELK